MKILIILEVGVCSVGSERQVWEEDNKQS